MICSQYFDVFIEISMINEGCFHTQDIETLSDVMNGCYFQSCKTVCPQMDQINCPACEEPGKIVSHLLTVPCSVNLLIKALTLNVCISVTFQNQTFCGCNQQKCQKKPCPPKVTLPYKACALRVICNVNVAFI